MHKVQISFPYFTGLPTDVVQNTFHFLFTVGSPVPSDFSLLLIDIEAFYTAIFTSVSLASMAPWIDSGAVSEKIYDLADPTPRTPVYEATSSYSVVRATNATTQPEVALCLSYQGTKISGLPQARRRGRLFIGGLGVATTAGDSDSFPVPTPTIITNMATAASGLIVSAAADGWEWNVWSETDQSGTAVTDGWIDNAFDTQRRRGNEATSRTTWT